MFVFLLEVQEKKSYPSQAKYQLAYSESAHMHIAHSNLSKT